MRLYYVPVLLVSFMLLLVFSPLSVNAQGEHNSVVPTLVVRDATKAVYLKNLDINLKVQSGFAETTLDMTFFNPNPRILEGELQFPLLPGQEISGIALDINGVLRSGVAVEKAKGQAVFEEVIRRKVDPALLESTKGNSYKLRIYPIPANGVRRVVIRVLQPLTIENNMLNYRLPLEFAKKLEHINLTVLVASENMPTIKAGNLGLTLENKGTLFHGSVKKTYFSPEGWLDLSLPIETKPTQPVQSVKWKDKIYFSAGLFVPVETKERSLPDCVTVVWDSSLSGLKRNHAQEFALLNTYFKAFNNGKVRLVLFNNVVENPQEFNIKNGDWSALKKVLAEVVYDGGTDLKAWTPQADCNEFLLFSDGLANFDNRLEGKILPEFTEKQRLFVINSAIEADRSALQAATQGKSKLIDLSTDSFEQAQAKLLKEGVRISLNSDELAGAGEVLLAGQSKYLFGGTTQGANELVRLAGWVTPNFDKQAHLKIEALYPSGEKKEFVLNIPSKESDLKTTEEAPLQARLWGHYKIEALEANYELNKSSISRLSKQLGIVSRETSLIVLETAQDYLRYDITPPEELKKEVERLSVNMPKMEKAEFLSKQQLLDLWNKKVAWWKTEFPIKKPLENKKDNRIIENGYEDEIARISNGNFTISQTFGRPFEDELATAAGVADDVPVPAPSPVVPGGGDSVMAMQRPRTMPAQSVITEETKRSSDVVTKPKSQAVATISLKAWSSDAPYIKRFKNAKDAELYAIYLDERPDYLQSSAFFVDVADRFFERGLTEQGVKILSNLAEIELENRQVLRLLAYRLIQAEKYTLALPILLKIKQLAPHEPQSFRDLALLYIKMSKYQEATELLYTTATKYWDPRFGEINTILLTELNAIVALNQQSLDTSIIDSELLTNLESDLRVVLSWDTDNVDMDLWVTDPDGERAFYRNKLTKQGGRMSADCTQGYGPEEFMLRKAKPGKYKVEVEYFGNSQQRATGEVSLNMTLFTHFGSKNQKEQNKILRLKNVKGNVLVGEFVIE